MKYNYNTIHFILIMITSAMLLQGCSDSSTDPNPTDSVLGIYSLLGEKIVTRYSDWPIPEGDEPAIDTLRFVFWLKIAKADGRKDTVRLYGVDSVDIGEGDDRVYPNCTVPEECKIFGRFVGEDLEIAVNNEGRSYQATAKIYQTYDPYIDMSADFHYQNTTIHYQVKGVRE